MKNINEVLAGMSFSEVERGLQLAGGVAETARLKGVSLDSKDRRFIMIFREAANKLGLSRIMQNTIEDEGAATVRNAFRSAISKVVLLGLAMFFILAPRAHAWEFERNPDRFPSIGLHVRNQSLSGDRTAVNQPTPVLSNVQDHGSMKNELDMVGGDIRLPVNNSLTITGAFDSVSSESVFTRDQNVYKSTDRLTGYQYELGIRLYLNK